ncbi:DKNYY domain-containing protein [Patescibacteria group bacterium]|nr:DKNYY domain-containing protein [Patescibacteria group bacterium]
MKKSIIIATTLFTILIMSGCSLNDSKNKAEEQKPAIIQDKQINKDYSIKNQNVYYHEYILEGVNAENFRIVGGNYVTDGNLVFHRNNIIKDANANNISALEGTEFATDGSFVYHPQYPDGGVASIELDSDSEEEFQIIGRVFAKYKDTIYCGAWPLEESDAETFQTISQFYAKDSSNIYTATCNIVNNIDPSTAEVISESGQFAYIKDKNKVFYLDNQIEGANPEYFVVLGEGYYVADDSNIYYSDQEHTNIKLENTDLNEFEVLNTPYARDISGDYYKAGVKISEKDYNNHINKQ